MHRVSRMVWESAVPPTVRGFVAFLIFGRKLKRHFARGHWQVIAATDLILTQVLGPKLLWHLFANAACDPFFYSSHAGAHSLIHACVR